MKNRVVVIFLMLVSALAFASHKKTITPAPVNPPSAGTLIGFKQYPPNSGKAVEVRILDSGEVIESVVDLHNRSEARTTTIAQLSPPVLNQIHSAIAQLPPSSKLVDQDPGGPVCEDKGSSFVVVLRASGRQQIQKDTGCHVYLNQDKNAQVLTNLVKSFATLTQATKI